MEKCDEKSNGGDDKLACIAESQRKQVVLTDADSLRQSASLKARDGVSVGFRAPSDSRVDALEHVKVSCC